MINWDQLGLWIAHLTGETIQGAVALFVMFLVLGLFLSHVWSKAVHATIHRDRDGRIDRLSAGFIRQIGHLFIWAVVLTLFAHSVPALNRFATTLLASVSIASVVIGLAAQSTLSNLVAGVGLIFYRPFRLGDHLLVTAPTGVETGKVETVSLGYTILQTADNRRIVLPNAVIASATTVNLTAVDARILAVVPLGIADGADIDRARAIALELAKAHPSVTEIVGCAVTALGPFSVDMALSVWCPEATTAATVKSDLLEAIRKRFDSEGIAAGSALGPWPQPPATLRTA